MNEFEIVATFDTPQTARSAAKLLNSWIAWVMEGADDDIEELEAKFEDFGISFEDYSIDRDTDTDWEEAPETYAEGNKVIVELDSDSSNGIETIKELLEAMGSYDVSVYGEED